MVDWLHVRLTVGAASSEGYVDDGCEGGGWEPGEKSSEMETD